MRYDEVADTLYLSFSPGEGATGIELNEHVLLRVDKQIRRAIGITLMEFSTLAQETDLGPRSFPLTGLAELSSETRDLAIEILRSVPVSDYLALSNYTPTLGESIPIASLKSEKILARAA